MKLGLIGGVVFNTRLRASAPEDLPRPDLASPEVVAVVRTASKTIDAVLSGGQLGAGWSS